MPPPFGASSGASSGGHEATTHFEVQADEADERIDRYLGRSLFPRFSRSYLSGLIRAGQVLVNGQRIKQSYRVEAGDRIEARVGEPSKDTPEAEEVAFDVLYEDDHLAVIYKPAGMLVHPGTTSAQQSGTVVNGLLQRYPKVRTVGVIHRPGIVHRLDRDTSGLMVVALSNQARIGLFSQFKNREVRKVYFAIVTGKLTLQSDYIDLPIGNHPKFHDRMKIDVTRGKSSSTFYEVQERFEEFSLVRLHPLTGRTHQIRVHLAHLGNPVTCDPAYGRSAAHVFQRLKQKLQEEGRTIALHRQALHAHRLEFTHPVDGRAMVHSAPLPADMAEFLEILRERAP
jgi:23S rRNA pseudouridine1911/1915/1917 synthase